MCENIYLPCLPMINGSPIDVWGMLVCLPQRVCLRIVTRFVCRESRRLLNCCSHDHSTWSLSPERICTGDTCEGYLVFSARPYPSLHSSGPDAVACLAIKTVLTIPTTNTTQCLPPIGLRLGSHHDSPIRERAFLRLLLMYARGDRHLKRASPSSRRHLSLRQALSTINFRESNACVRVSHGKFLIPLRSFA